MSPTYTRTETHIAPPGSEQSQSLELVYLMERDRLMTRAMGGILPEQPADAFAKGATILDLACGPAGWAVEAAFHFPGVQVCGVDKQPSMVRYARARAQSQGLADYTDFLVMDITCPLAFDNDRFDLVNARLLSSFLAANSWPALLRECWRVLKPGGIMRLTEWDVPLSNSPALQRLSGYLSQACTQEGRTFVCEGRSQSIVSLLGKLLHEANFASVQHRPFLLDASFYTASHLAHMKLTEVCLTLLKPWLLVIGVVEETLFDELYTAFLIEMLGQDFTYVQFGLTVWGVKSCSNT